MSIGKKGRVERWSSGKRVEWKEGRMENGSDGKRVGWKEGRLERRSSAVSDVLKIDPLAGF